MTSDRQQRDQPPGEPPGKPPGETPGDEATALTIVDHREAGRYEARIGEQLAGWVEYGRVQDRLVAFHTEVPPEFGGRGIGSALVRRVLDDARASGLKVTPRCPLFATHFKRHPEDADLLSERPAST